MSEPKYPKRPPFFANRVIRLLQKSCAANSIGIDACWLVACIAQVEDSKRYSGPVTFWTAQLLPIAGFASWGRLDRARKLAVDAGWLHYKAGTNHKCGVYWTLIPEAIEQAFDDSPVDATDHHNGNRSEVNHHCGAHNDEQHVIDTKSKRGRNGEPSKPVPLPTKEAAVPEVKFPETLDTEEFRTAWCEWVQYRRESKKKLTTSTVSKQLAMLAAWGSLKAVQAIGLSISNGWAGLFDPGERQGRTLGSDAEAETAWESFLDSLKRRSRFEEDKIIADVGERAWKAAKVIGLKRIEEASDFEKRELKEKFIQAFNELGAT